MTQNLKKIKYKIFNLVICLAIIIHPLLFTNIRGLTSKYNIFLDTQTKINISEFLDVFLNFNLFNIRLNILNNFPPFFYIIIILIFLYYLFNNFQKLSSIKFDLNIKLFSMFFTLFIFYILLFN